eukprot:CAMPEP_0201508282 /NCGR_PEP_ID=MMETSP0161_2-20130828/1700_1 /ASSEMBLY_ACC=CAM_ASM_000251 /TAXON_ID=180227 /ORGANISM="Neoparamoeba aestuarina, Strain SoJaBio B1-5/56/2" /LENGTH=66 /DNA_ID=CAMNT_0047902897 /DNA_START=376 /DNA_END=573 /DNA_ORIENTATION=-
MDDLNNSSSLIGYLVFPHSTHSEGSVKKGVEGLGGRGGGFWGSGGASEGAIEEGMAERKDMVCWVL